MTALATAAALELLGTVTYAGSRGNGNYASSLLDEFAKYKTVCFTSIAIMVMVYSIIKRKKHKSKDDAQTILHNKQVEEVIRLRSIYRSKAKNMSLDEKNDNQCTTKCHSCGTINLLYSSHCKNCQQFLPLDQTIKLYEEQIKYIEFISGDDSYLSRS